MINLTAILFPAHASRCRRGATDEICFAMIYDEGKKQVDIYICERREVIDDTADMEPDLIIGKCKRISDNIANFLSSNQSIKSSLFVFLEMYDEYEIFSIGDIPKDDFLKEKESKEDKIDLDLSDLDASYEG